MKAVTFTCLLACVFMFAGCSVRIESHPEHHPLPPSHGYPEDAPSNFPARISAAQSISSFSKRDAAFSDIAIDAARVCNTRYTVKAISLMSSFSKRDSTAEKCVDFFLEEYLLEDARRIANQVSSFRTKDRILSKIAQTSAVSTSE